MTVSGRRLRNAGSPPPPARPAVSDTPVPPSALRAARFIAFVAAVLTVVMVLFPPYTSISGAEYAFVLTGPAWAHHAGTLGADLGLSARIDWARLAVQFAAVWALAFGAWRFLGSPQSHP